MRRITTITRLSIDKHSTKEIQDEFRSIGPRQGILIVGLDSCMTIQRTQNSYRIAVTGIVNESDVVYGARLTADASKIIERAISHFVSQQPTEMANTLKWNPYPAGEALAELSKPSEFMRQFVYELTSEFKARIREQDRLIAELRGRYPEQRTMVDADTNTSPQPSEVQQKEASVEIEKQFLTEKQRIGQVASAYKHPSFHLQPKHVWGALAAAIVFTYAIWPTSEEEKRQASQQAAARVEKERLVAEETARQEEKMRESRTRIAEMQRSAAEIRDKSLAEWDNAIRNDIEDRRARLEKASKRHEIKVIGGSRFDNYVMKDGRVIVCRTKVNDNGTFMDCDGDM